MCKSIFCTYLSRILCFLECKLRPDFKKVKFDVRRSLEPFKDLDESLAVSGIPFNDFRLRCDIKG